MMNSADDKATGFDRNRVLLLSDADLLRECRVETLRANGRGGQKRNRTESGVRVTHLDSGIVAFSDETRSQHTNRGKALQLLRSKIALECRVHPAVVWDGRWRPALKAADYGLWLALVFDVLTDSEFRVGDAAQVLGVTTGRLVRDLAVDEQAFRALNRERQIREMPVLRA